MQSKSHLYSLYLAGKVYIYKLINRKNKRENEISV
jgi:hypothetical protein